jgi:hypothetical protein
MYMTQKPSEKGQRKPGAEVAGAEELYRQYLLIRAERARVRSGGDQPVKEIKKAKSGDTLS